jgi:integrase
VYEVAEIEQDKLMLFTYLQTGARRDELFRLRWVDVDFLAREFSYSVEKRRQGDGKAVGYLCGKNFSICC